MLSGVLGRHRTKESGNVASPSSSGGGASGQDRSRSNYASGDTSMVSVASTTGSSSSSHQYPQHQQAASSSQGMMGPRRQPSMTSMSSQGSSSRKRGPPPTSSAMASAASMSQTGSSHSGYAPSSSYATSTAPALLPEEMRAMQKEKERERQSLLQQTEMGMGNRQSGGGEGSLNGRSTASSGTNSGSINGKSAASTSTSTRAPYSSNHMESATTRLLMATKLLLEALTKWSTGQKSETEVSDIYVRLGNDFNTARMAFGSYGIDTSDLASVPEDLRGCLERCLSEDASPGVLDRHLPQVREIIVHLLQGLKQKQAEYKRLIAPVQKPVSSRTHGGPTGASRAASIGQRDSRSILQGMSGGSSRTASGTASPDSSSYHDGSSVTTRTFTPSTQRTSSSHTFDGDEESPPTPTKASAKGGPSSSIGSRMLPVDIPSSALSEEFSPSESPAISRMVPSPSMSRLASPRSVKPSLGTVGESEAGTAMDVTDADPSLRALKSRDALERRASKRFSAYTFNKMGVGQPFGQNNFGSQTLGMSTLGTASNQASPNADKRAERRARKNKAEGLDDRPSPHSAPAMPDRSQSNSVDHLSEASEAYPSRARAKDPSTPSRSGKSTVTPTTSSLQPLPDVNTDQEAATTTLGVSGIPPVPPLPSSEETARLSATHDFITKQQGSRITSGSSDRTLGARNSGTASGLAPPFSQVTPTREAEAGPLAEPSEVQIFLQLGRQTRKASLEAGSEISIGRLRMLFVDRFAYSPGQDDFPTIYIKDPHSGVSYELEDLGDITSGCMLTLNIEPLDQVKQHLDISLGTISKELREVKQALQEQKERESALLASRRFSSTPMLAAATFPPASPNKFSDSQFAAAGQRVASLQQRRPSAAPAASIPADKARATSSSPSSASSGARIAGDLKAHYEEVLNLRRDMAILQQLQGDFSGDVGGLLKAMKEQSAKVRAIAATEVPTERNFILAGKSKLDGNSQEVLTLIEDLQDIVDDLKLDVIQRGVKPKPATLKKISGDIDRATQGLEDLEKYVQTVKPSWKKTWESELQNIVDEQEFLNHQESLISDLRDDHSALQEVYENIQQVVKLRSAGRPAGGKYIPPLPEEGHEGLSSVMFEVKGQQIDHDRRLRALQAAEKTRQREIASRTDEFTEELAGFVHGSKAPEAGAGGPIGLRKTGGHLEVERIRSKRDKATLLAMFGAGGSGGAPLEVDVQKPKKLLIPVGGGSAAAAAGKAGAGKASSTASPSSLASAISTSDSEAGRMLTVGGPADGSASSHGSSLARTAEEGEEDDDERSGDVNGDVR